jgi:hypothetical protein
MHVAKKSKNFYNAWWFLALHPKFNHLKDGKPDILPGFMSNLDMHVAKVDPKTRIVSKAKNAVTEIWLEAGPWAEITGEPPGTYDEVSSHDIRLDCGGDTYEEAIIKMASLVKKYYGDHKETE